jgi:putative thioredoxin
VLLDIWAEWCGPCKALGPVLEQLEVEYAGRFLLAKVNADEQQEIAGQLSQMFGVRSIPFCVMFVGGQPVDGFVGALPAEKIREFLDKHVPGEGEIALNWKPWRPSNWPNPATRKRRWPSWKTRWPRTRATTKPATT